MVEELEAREQALKADLKALRSDVRLGLPEIRLSDLGSAHRYRERIGSWFNNVRRDALAERLQAGDEVRKALIQAERKVRALEHQLRQKKCDLAKTEALLTPEQKHQMEQKSRSRWARDREQELGL